MTRKRSRRPRDPAQASAADTSIPEIPGYGLVDLQPSIVAPVYWNAAEVADETKTRILRFLRARETVALLAKSGEQLLRELAPGQIGPGASGLEQVHVELLQAFVLAAGIGKPVPASAHSMVRLWRLAMNNLVAYMTEIGPNTDTDTDTELTYRIRLRTISYRNFFSSDDAMDVIPTLFSHMDAVARRELGYALSDFARALFEIFKTIGERFYKRIERENLLRKGLNVDGVVEGMLQGSERTQRTWRLMDARAASQQIRGQAAFQMAEMLCAPLFTFDRHILVERFGEPIATALFSCALPFGAIAETDLPRIYLANPIWKRPFIALDADTLFLPLPVLIISFPFLIIEGLIDGHAKLQAAYSAARARYLEEDVKRIVRQSLPSAAIYHGVKWTDPDSGLGYENDIVAVLGMHVLIFEAKSGKLSSSSRRGGVKSLKTNFAELFVKPGEQATRLEMLLARRLDDFKLVDRNGDIVRIDPAGPSVVHKFGICIEQFASVTSSRKLFRELGLLERDREWAPILTLGELRMISARLDTELSFFHYLTRRATIDDLLDFIADEQDLLALYLSNGFAFDAQALQGRQVVFHKADAKVRGRATPRGDRREFATLGVTLPPMWRLIAKEFYQGSHRHRFDVLVSILNQHPSALTKMEERVRRWRSGAGLGQGNTLTNHTIIGDRVFVVAVHMAKEPPPDEQSWNIQSGIIGQDLARKLGATDCVVILKVRRSNELTFDGFGFFRVLPSSHRPSAATHVTQ
jgi:hypothetical protein